MSGAATAISTAAATGMNTLPARSTRVATASANGAATARVTMPTVSGSRIDVDTTTAICAGRRDVRTTEYCADQPHGQRDHGYREQGQHDHQAKPVTLASAGFRLASRQQGRQGRDGERHQRDLDSGREVEPPGEHDGHRGHHHQDSDQRTHSSAGRRNRYSRSANSALSP